MSKEHSYAAVILKKQAFNEIDEIITVFTREAGKLRLLAKSVKGPKSKLQHALQVLFLVRLQVAGGKLPKIIGSQVENSFSGLRQNLAAIKCAFYALELCLKFTPDEQKNEKLFDLLCEYFGFLNQPGNGAEALDLALLKFKIEILKVLGMGIRAPSGYSAGERISFSHQLGGFATGESPDFSLDPEILSLFLVLEKGGFPDCTNLPHPAGLRDLQALLSAFVEYQLEREVMSEKYLNQEL